MLILTEGAGIEGTAIIAANMEEKIKNKVPADVIERAKNFLYDPGICVLGAAQIAWKHSPSALHDPTEGGVRKGIEEMAIASKLGVHINMHRIFIRPETQEICRITSKDPLAIFGSGSLLIAISKEMGSHLLSEYSKAGIQACEIGVMTAENAGRRIAIPGEGMFPLVASHTDELISELMQK